MLGGGKVKELYELKGEGRSIRGIARELGVSRNTVRKYARASGVPKPKPRAKRGSKLEAYKEYIDGRLSEGLENCVVVLREIRELGYEGCYATLTNYVRGHRRPRQPSATMRFETESGEQAQVDWGVFSYIGEDGRKHRMWAFVMVLGWSRAIYVEFVRRADVAAFIRCHLNAFDYFGGCGHSYNMTADRMYWVDEQPMLSTGWYCNECVDKLEGKSRDDRLNMEIFLIMLDSDFGAG